MEAAKMSIDQEYKEKLLKFMPPIEETSNSASHNPIIEFPLMCLQVFLGLYNCLRFNYQRRVCPRSKTKLEKSIVDDDHIQYILDDLAEKSSQVEIMN